MAIPHSLFVVEAAPSFADRSIRAGCGRLEEDDVFYSTNDGGMGENPPIASIIVGGRVGAVGGVGGPESRRRASKAIRGSNNAIGCVGGAGREGWLAPWAGRWPRGRAEAPSSSLVVE